MKYPVLLLSWPPRNRELRRIDWSDYLQNPAIGLLVDPATGEPFDDIITVRVRVLDLPPTGSLTEIRVGEITELPLSDYLTAESQRLDLGRIPWAELIEFKVNRRPPPLDLPDRRKELPTDFDAIKKFLFDVLEEGPLSELEVIGRAADSGFSPAALREVKDRLRIASIKDPDAEYPRTLWRLRMSQAYKLKKKRAPDARR